VGRRGIRVGEDTRWVFNRLADVYRHRPGYPDALVARLVELAGGPGRQAADLGAGTGHLALPLARAGLRVSAVEPARAMLDELTRLATVAGLSLDAVHAAAEDTGLPAGAFGLVFYADAAHWVDPERAGHEVARLLRPDGVCAVIEASLGHTPFLDDLTALLSETNPKARRPSRKAATRQILALARPGRRPSVEHFSHDVTLSPEALEGTLRSLSFVGPALGPEAVTQLLESAKALAVKHGGALWRRDLVLTSA